VSCPGATASRRLLLNANKRVPRHANGGVSGQLAGIAGVAVIVVALVITSASVAESIAGPIAAITAERISALASAASASSTIGGAAHAAAVQAAVAQEAAVQAAAIRAEVVQAATDKAEIGQPAARDTEVQIATIQAANRAARVTKLVVAPRHARGPNGASTAAVRLRVWQFALGQRGKPYIWGGTGPSGFDCSGLVYAAYQAAGITLPRTTYEMLSSSQLIQISQSQAQQGDLAFFGTGHVELYEAGLWTYGAQAPGTVIGFHQMTAFWHPTMYFRVRL
jgi:cell wall-associated NlpC family hydrolase